VADPESLSGVQLYSQMDDCLAQTDADAYFICVHTDLHYELTKKALQAGKHVFLEKPISLDILQGEELISLARDRNLVLMVAQVVRFMPPYLKLRQWITSGEFGRLKFLSLSRFAGVPLWGEWKEKQLNFGSSGGALFDLVMHDIDFVQSLLGMPDEIKSNVLPGLLSHYDYVTALWSYHEENIKVKIEGGNTFHSNFPFQAGYAAQFENASILYTTFQPDFITISTDTEMQKVTAGDSNDGCLREVDYFAHCMAENIWPAECSPESALQTIRLCYDHLK
jgi:predicted dehydrogenase